MPTQYIRDGSFKAALSNASLAYGDHLKGLIRAYLVGSTYGNKVYDITIGTGSGVTQFTSGGIINNTAGGYTDLVPYGIALDMDNKKLWIGNPTLSATTWNNETSVSPASNTGGFNLEFDEYSMFVSNNEGTSFVNFGQYVGPWNGNSVTDHTSTAGGNFTLAPPTDFKAINQDNLDDTEDKLTAWAWIKNRDATDNHMLFDKVRGVGNDLHSNDTAVEVFNVNTVQRFLQRGVQIGSDVEVNTANESYVLWQWANDGTRTANTAGAKNIFETVSTPGHFAIFDWDGNSTAGAFQHNMGGAIEMIIVKRRNVSAWNWYVWHKAIPATKAYLLDTNDTGHISTYWNDIAVPSGTPNEFTLGATEGINKTGDEIISYAFRSVPGVCKVGSYIGNGSATAPPYVSVGFKPSWVMIKNTSVARDWVITDTARSPLNPAELFLFPNLDIAEAARGTSSGSDYDIDLLADGFRPLTGDSAPNGSGNTILYMAMADIGGNGTLPPVYGR